VALSVAADPSGVKPTRPGARMPHNARRLPTLDAEDGQCPRARAAPATDREGRRASSRINGCRGSVRPAGAEGGGRRREHEHWRQPMSRSAAEGELCDRRRREHRPGPGGPTCGDEQGTTWVLCLGETSGRPARRGRPEGPSGRSLVLRCHAPGYECYTSSPRQDLPWQPTTARATARQPRTPPPV
jgi:hypothetical protein